MATQSRGIYRSYQFKDHDPILDNMDTIMRDEGVDPSQVHEVSGVSTTTIYNWRKRKTKRPQFATVMAVARSLGYDLQMIRSHRRASSPVTMRRNIRAKSEARASLQ